MTELAEGARGVTAAGVRMGVGAAGVRRGDGDCGADNAAIDGVVENPVAAE